MLAYSLDGDLPQDRMGDVGAIRQASLAFRMARGGLSNAEIALEWLSKKVPEVNAKRIYTVGHSSAGTVALLVAEHNRRNPGVRGLCAGGRLLGQLRLRAAAAPAGWGGHVARRVPDDL